MAGWWTLWKHKVKLVFSKDGHSPMLRTQLGQWHESVQPEEWNVLALTRGEFTEVYRRHQDGEYDLLRDFALGKENHVCVLDVPMDVVDILPDGTAPAMLGR